MQHSRSPRERVAGETAMREVLSSQSTERPRGFFARLLGRSPLGPLAKRAYTKAFGNLIVGKMLSDLGQRWDVLHEISLKRPDSHSLDGETAEEDRSAASFIDHLAIGPAGVFTIHVANCREREVIVNGTSFVVAGVERDDLRDAAAEADAAAALLSDAGGSPVRVRPVLVVIEPRRLNVKVAASVVRVVVAQELERFLLNAPKTLDGDEVARISDLADRDDTWPADQGEPLDTLELVRNFELVRSEVRAARRRRTTWVAVGIAIAYLGVWGCIATVVTVLIRG